MWVVMDNPLFCFVFVLFCFIEEIGGFVIVVLCKLRLSFVCNRWLIEVLSPWILMASVLGGPEFMVGAGG